VVEENTAMGNTNGIIVFPAATNTRIRGNVVIGNPAIQVSTGVSGSAGVDIWILSAPGATTFDKNLCLTSINAPCPDQAAGTVPRKPGGR
jgi:parallel beta-helix repeat protein